MEVLYVAVALAGLVAVVALVGVFALRSAIADARLWAERKNECRSEEHKRLQEDVWALMRGMDALGMKRVPAETMPVRWVKNEPVES
jgi:hypothetical protein